MTATPVYVLATFRPAPDRDQELEDLLHFMVQHTRQEPGCTRYDLFRTESEDGRARFHLFECYEDGQALEAHRGADYYVEYRSKAPDLLEAPIEVLVLDPVDVAAQPEG